MSEKQRSVESVADYQSDDPSTDDTQTHSLGGDALAEAISKQKPKLWTKRMLKLYLCLIIGALNSVIYGYDGSLMSSINSYPQYREYFGFDPAAGTPATGIVFAIYPIGSIAAFAFAGPASDLWGRRVGMLISAIVIIVGTIIQATSLNITSFLIGRFILGFGASLNITAGSSYASEMAHPIYRGFMTSLYMVLWFFGGIPAAFICWRTSKIQGTMSWRLPICLQVIFPSVVIIFCMLLPESPRWLMSHSKHDRALDVLAEYHGDGDRDSPIVQLEYHEMLREISKTGSDKRWWDYRELYNTREARYRSMLVLLIACYPPLEGVNAVAYYYPQMLSGAGVNSVDIQLLLVGILGVVGLTGTLTGAFLTDRIRRRTQLLTATVLTTIFITIALVLNATNIVKTANGYVVKSGATSRAQIAMFFLFVFVFCAGWSANQVLYPLECLRFETRAKGMSLYMFINNIGTFYTTFVTGIAFTGIGWKYYIVFAVWNICSIFVVYFLFPETSKRTLEEMAVIFQSKHPVKTSLKKLA